LTASYAQTGNVFIIKGDTLVSYNKSELQKIAARMVRSQECDTLLILGEQQLIKKDIALKYKDSLLNSKDSVIHYKNLIINSKKEIIIGKNNELDRTHKAINKLNRKLKFSKVGLYTSVAGLILSTVLLLIK
jgi:hypothetical protein